MGYESKLYIVEKYDTGLGDIIASFDLSKAPNIHSAIVNYPKSTCHIYLDGDSNYAVSRDRYGDPLIEVPIKDMIELLETEIEHDSYRRLRPCLALLRGFDVSEWPNLVVLHYGY